MLENQLKEATKKHEGIAKAKDEEEAKASNILCQEKEKSAQLVAEKNQLLATYEQLSATNKDILARLETLQQEKDVCGTE